MTILGNAAKNAVLVPLYAIALAVGAVVPFLAGWGLASLVTGEPLLKWAAGVLVMLMGLGAFVGAREAARQ